ncbi:tectonic-2 [Spea bombifrons]|uniref:tectonic-2 n=1 Tax=Spea bombifrons TaxID=233779 RepID=UPI00234A9F79|nr:tectonic-2 [Spea bombifrons]
MGLSGVRGLLWFSCILLTTASVAQNIAGFFPSRILLTGLQATSFLVTNSSSVRLSLSQITDATTVQTAGCSGSSNINDWLTSLEPLSNPNVYKVTLALNKTLTLCTVNETDCCAESLCRAESLRVSACVNNVSVASLLLQAEIYVNTTFSGNVSDNATVILNQAYQPLGSCPCNLTAGACDVGCCCDMECSSSVKELFNGFCYPGVFGGNVTPAFDQLCSVQEKSRAPDWYPFLCVQSSIDNSPFLGYFFQGSVVSVGQRPAFSMNSVPTVQDSPGGYRQGAAILIDQNGVNEYFTIPQQSTNGACETNAPVAYLQNFVATCVSNVNTCADVLIPNLNMPVRDGNGGTIVPSTDVQNITVDNYIIYSDTSLSPVVQCRDVIISADYTFIWEARTLRAINVTIVTADINLTHRAQLTQRFTATFLTSDRAGVINVLSGNPGYQIGKPVIAANGSSPLTRTTISLWKPVGDGSCSSANQSPILYGQDSYSGCILQVVNEDCNQLREIVTTLLKSLVPANYIAMRGNSNVSDLSEWVPIIFEDNNATCSGGDCLVENVMCSKVPVNMNIQMLTAVTGAVEGIAQEEILGARISFSTVNVECSTACTLSLPLSSSVQFIKVPAQPAPRISSFRMNYTEYDCEKNDVCWQQLAYPLTKYYTGEPHHLTLAKGMILVFFFIVASVLGGPWNRIRKAWNSTTL